MVVRILGVILLYFLSTERAWAQQEEPPADTEFSTPDESKEAGLPEDDPYAWYQYSPGDSTIHDSAAPRYPVWSLGIRLGNAGYIGELNQRKLNPFSSGFSLAPGIIATRHLSRMFETSLEFHYIPLSAESEGRKFKATAKEFTANITLNINQTFTGYTGPPRKLQFYAFFGTGFNFFNTEFTQDSLPAVNRKSSDLMWVSGVSAGYRLRPNMELGALFSYRYLNSDVIDGVGGPYSGNDSYTYLGLSFRYLLNRPSKRDEDIVSRLKKEMLSYMLTDTDGDGVPDYLDLDNSTPKGTLTGVDGKPLDTDGDGIPDAIDTDPFTPPGMEVDEKGMPSDRDGDGVPDYRDSEPDSKSDALVNYQGKSIPVKEKTKTQTGSDTQADTDIIRRVINTWNLSLILFAEGSSKVDDKYYMPLSELAFLMLSQSDITIEITGHTDAKGNQKINEKLALARAEEVVRIMNEVYSIPKSRCKSRSASFNEPLVNTSQSGNLQAHNRRAEIRIKLKGTEIR